MWVTFPRTMMYMYTSDAMKICSQAMKYEDFVFVSVMSKAYVYDHSQITMKNKKGGKDVRMDVNGKPLVWKTSEPTV